jgi:hypothetical protein
MAAMRRPGSLIEGHLGPILGPSASGGPDRLGDEWGWLVHPRFSLLWMRLQSLGGVSPRVLTVRLRGGVTQLLQEEDPRTFADEGLPCRHVAQLLQTGGVQEMEEKKEGRGRESIATPPPGVGAGSWRRRRRLRRRQ